MAAHSGGHIIPCLTLAEQEVKKSKKTILFFTSSKHLDRSILKGTPLALTHIELPIFQSRKWYLLPVLCVTLVYSFFKSFFQLLAVMPDKIVTTGSIVAMPVCLAGWILGIPIELFELNAQPGKTIFMLSYCASIIRHCFTNAVSHFPNTNCIQTPYPIRFTKSRQVFSPANFSSNRVTIFVQGGSQGSTSINSLMKKVIPSLQLPVQVIHQTGSDPEKMSQFYQDHHIPAHVFSFDSDMAQFYEKADIVICRSGAGALFETLHFKKQCITIPLAMHASNHQLQNALQAQSQHPSLVHVALNKNQVLMIFKKIALLS